MSFGFGVGDFIAVGKLIVDISSILQDASGSKYEYQELLRELESLQHALTHLDKLPAAGSSSNTSDSIKSSALSCRFPLEQFLSKIKKYNKSLGVWGKEGAIRTTADKLKWAYTEKDQINKLQNYLSVHIGTINILLAEHGLERMSIASERGERDQFHVRERLDGTRKLIERIKDSVAGQALAIATNNSMLTKLFQLVSGELRTSFKSFGEMISKVCVSTQQIYKVVLEIKANTHPGTPDVRWSFFQAPILVEDALGLKFPMPSEFDYNLLETIIKHRFLDGPGALDVASDNYELFNTNDSSKIISPEMKLLPGTKITMAILLATPALVDQTCPMPRCKSSNTSVAAGGGRFCGDCGVWFDMSKKKRNDINDLVDAANQLESTSSRRKRRFSSASEPRKRLKLTTEESMVSIRNVKWTPEDILPEKGPDPQQTSNIKRPDRLEFTDAMSFVNQVKARFRDDPGYYQSFLRILQKFQRKEQNFVWVVKQVEGLFTAHRDLLQGFEMFHQNASELVQQQEPIPVVCTSINPQLQPTLDAARSYLDLLQLECPDKYPTLIRILQHFKAKEVDTHGVVEHFKHLFADKETLIRGFRSFLPTQFYAELLEKPPDPNFVWNLPSTRVDESRPVNSWDWV